jgi:hypothetical protein
MPAEDPLRHPIQLVGANPGTRRRLHRLERFGHDRSCAAEACEITLGAERHDRVGEV